MTFLPPSLSRSFDPIFEDTSLRLKIVSNSSRDNGLSERRPMSRFGLHTVCRGHEHNKRSHTRTLSKSSRSSTDSDDDSRHHALHASRNKNPIALTTSGYSPPRNTEISPSFSFHTSTSSRRIPRKTLASEPSRSPHLPHPQPRLQISSLLSDSDRPRTYHLEVVQQPLRTAEYRNSPLSRLPLTPPIIVQLVVRDLSGNPVAPAVETPFFVAHLSLFSEDGMTRIDTGPSTSIMDPPFLYGNTIASLHYLEDLQGNMGHFFLFPDVSIRWKGRFQIGITLLRLSSFNSPDSSGLVGTSHEGTILAETRTRPFDVLSYGQYSAVPPTRLTQSFVRQGARMFPSMSHP